MSAPRILIVDDQRAVREELAFALDYEGYRTLEAPDGAIALEMLEEKGDVAAVLLDIKMPGEDGLQILKKIRTMDPALPVIMISGHGDIETAVVAVKGGAMDFLPKPFDSDRVLVSIKNALRLSALATENTALRQELARDHQILGGSDAIAQVRSMIERVAPTEAQVLITGENGTGKELVARQVHQLSRRSQQPFVAVNCAAIPADLVESALFGHEKGAFTGANAQREGHFEAADKGTLFLDEIGEMALDAQAKLLRALQEKVIQRVGGSEEIAVDVRVLAATNKDLQELVAEKTFREDLYYRLHVIRIHAPPLRERPDDIPLLADHFLGEACKRNGVAGRHLTEDASRWLAGRSWPGNVRQLRNMMEAAAILAEGDDVDQEDLAAIATPPTAGTADPDWFAHPTLEEFKAASEREFIRRKLEENSGNIKRTAERIQIQRSNLYKKLDKYRLR